VHSSANLLIASCNIYFSRYSHFHIWPQTFIHHPCIISLQFDAGCSCRWSPQGRERERATSTWHGQTDSPMNYYI